MIEYPELPMPPLGEITTVAPGVHWVRMPLPFALNHINLWLLDDEIDGRQGYTLIDTGIASDAIRTAWETLWAGPLKDKPILRIVATHMHPDHIGLAGWISSRFDAPLWMTHGDYCLARMLSSPGMAEEEAQASDEGLAHYRRHGVTGEQTLAQLSGRKSYFPSLVSTMPRAYRRIRDHETFQIGGLAWQVIVGHGHSPEHASLHCAALGLVITGDMLLPKISTNVSVWALEPDADPVGLFITSLQRYLPLAENTLALPSHGLPFTGIHARVQQLQGHHQARLQELEAALSQADVALNAAQAVPVLFHREMDTHQLQFALGEALAHLNHLWLKGLAHRDTDSEGIVRFSRRV